MSFTAERAKELIKTLTDDDLIDFATTASRKDVRLAAEMKLRQRYPSKKKAVRRRGRGVTRREPR